jgi:hypothetical protein
VNKVVPDEESSNVLVIVGEEYGGNGRFDMVRKLVALELGFAL